MGDNSPRSGRSGACSAARHAWLLHRFSLFVAGAGKSEKSRLPLIDRGDFFTREPLQKHYGVALFVSDARFEMMAITSRRIASILIPGLLQAARVKDPEMPQILHKLRAGH